MCSNQTGIFTVSCFTNTPLINGDNNNQLTAGSAITGTSTEPTGTTIKLYTAANTLVATTAVQANGTWSTGNAGTTPAIYNAVAATTYYANAQNGTCGLSTNSAGYSTLAPTSAGRCGTITGPISSAVGSISGTLTGSFSTSTVNLYLDGQNIGNFVTSNTAWGPITVNSTINNTLYSNGVLSIGIQESGKQEVSCPSSALSISCSPTPVAPVYTPTSINILRNQTITYSISNAAAGTFYAVADSATGQSLGQGKWATTNGLLTITTNPFTTAGTFKVVFRSTSLSGVTQCNAISSTGTVNVSATVLPLTLIQFKGKKQGDNNILLDWTTVNESQVNRFEIERSNDGSAFDKIGDRAATGNSSTNKTYSFTDTNPFSTLNYYRLKMIDNDGKYSYSNVIVFIGNPKNGIIVSNVKPNPFTETINLNIVLQQAQLLTIQMADMTGRVVLTKDVSGKEGSNDIKYNGLSGLSDGIYFIRIITADALLQQKILKIN